MRIIIGLVLLTSGCVEYDPDGPPEPFDWPPHEALPLEPERVVDYYEAPPRQSIDILFVVDDSGSMSDNQARLQENAPLMVLPLTVPDIDAHIGVTTTSTTGIVQWVDTANTDDQLGVIIDMLGVGLRGDADEDGMGSILAAFRARDTLNAGFFRDDVPMHIVLISDEIDGTTEDEAGVSFETLMLWMSRERARRHGQLTFTAIVNNNPVPDPECPAMFAPSYMLVATLFPGQTIPICGEDWSGAFENAAKEFTETNVTIPLSRLPVVDSLVVMLNRGEQTVIPLNDQQWEYNEAPNTVSLGWVPRDVAAHIEVSYRVR